MGSLKPEFGRMFKRHVLEVEILKRIIDEYTVTNASKNNAGGKQRMMTAREARLVISLTKLLSYCGVSRIA